MVRRLNAEEAVAGIAETGNDVAASVQLAIDGSGEDRQSRITFLHTANALRRRDEVHQPNVARAEFGHEIHGGHGAATGGEHGVDEDHFKVG